MFNRREIPPELDDCIRPSANPVATAAGIAIIFVIVIVAFLYFKPKTAMEANALEQSQTIALIKVLRTVQEFDREITKRELRLDAVEAGPLETRGSIAEYYALLSNLHWLRKERAMTANNYNCSMRNLHNNGFPMEELARDGLPTRIR